MRKINTEWFRAELMADASFSLHNPANCDWLLPTINCHEEREARWEQGLKILAKSDNLILMKIPMEDKICVIL